MRAGPGLKKMSGGSMSCCKGVFRQRLEEDALAISVLPAVLESTASPRPQRRAWLHKIGSLGKCLGQARVGAASRGCTCLVSKSCLWRSLGHNPAALHDLRLRRTDQVPLESHVLWRGQPALRWSGRGARHGSLCAVLFQSTITAPAVSCCKYWIFL